MRVTEYSVNDIAIARIVDDNDGPRHILTPRLDAYIFQLDIGRGSRDVDVGNLRIIHANAQAVEFVIVTGAGSRGMNSVMKIPPGYGPSHECVGIHEAADFGRELQPGPRVPQPQILIIAIPDPSLIHRHQRQCIAAHEKVNEYIAQEYALHGHTIGLHEYPSGRGDIGTPSVEISMIVGPVVHGHISQARRAPSNFHRMVGAAVGDGGPAGIELDRERR
mmetsp:Transcript_26575/g.63720  ORF Transcript_26575/g.63720 Transcript_26575/m.63720 type:complete len:220 (-) Transcript_26575:468-1127(-)